MSLNEFPARVRNVMVNFSIGKINKIILTMNKTISMTLKRKGERIKYFFKNTNSNFYFFKTCKAMKCHLLLLSWNKMTKHKN